MALTYFYRNTTSDLTGSPSEIGNFDLLQETGASSSQINTGNLASGGTASCWFFTPADDPGTDGTSTGDFTLELRIDIQNANIGIRCYLQRYNSGGTAQGSLVEATEGSQTAGTATRQYNWTNPGLSTWAAGDRLGVRVQFTNISGLMNQSCRLGANLETDTLITPFTAAAPVDLVIDDTEHAHSASNVTLSEPPSGDDIAWDDSQVIWSGQVATWVDAGGATDLTIDSAAHAHAADSPSLTQAHNLAADDTAHAHTADNVTLSVAGDLDIDDATHVHSATTVDLTQTHILAADAATHSHTAESPELGVEGALSIHDATHGHTVGPTAAYPPVYEETYGSTEIRLTETNPFVIHDAVHAHSAQSPTLALVHHLLTDDAAHAHTADNVTLSGEGALGIHDATHAHAAASPTLTQVHLLATADAAHAHTAGNVVLGDGGAVLVDLHFIALAPELTHGPALAPELVVRAALAPETSHGAAGAPETAARAVGVPALAHGEPGAPELNHGQPEHDLVHGDAGEPTV